MILQVSPEAPALVRGAATALLVLHIGGGALGILSGWTAMLASKGGRVHRIAGNVFFAAMLTMAGVGAAVAPFLPEAQWTNTTAGVFTFYLVATSWATVRRPEGEAGRFELCAFLVAFAVAAMGAILIPVGIQTGRAAGFATVYGIAAIAAVAAIGDYQMIRRGGLTGAARVARHLWRMSLALVVATGSFFIGQPRYMPEPIRGTIVPALPVIAAVILLVFWMVRVRLGHRVKTMLASPSSAVQLP